MKFWQRALKSVTRRKGRSFILFLVIFILGNVIAGAVAIEQSTRNVEEETKKQMGTQATIEMDYEAFDQDMQKNPEKFEGDMELQKPPSLKEYEAVGGLPYVKYYDLSVPAYFGTNKVKGYVPENSGFSGMGANYVFSVKGTNRTELVDVEEGLIKLIEGEAFTEKDLQDGSNKVVISKEVAELNNLSVGDQLVIDVTGQYYPGEGQEVTEEEMAEPETITFDFPVKVAGIFSVVKKEDSGKQTNEQKSEAQWQAMDQINTLYAPNELAKNVQKQIDEKIRKLDATEAQEDYYAAKYILKSIDDVEAFREEANALITNKYYKIFASTDEYEQIAGGMKKLGTISQYVVLIAALATVLIISLVILLFLRDRKHELGIYLSLGESRGEIIGQIVMELLLTSVIALVLSLVTGNLLGGLVSNSFLQTEWLNPDTSNMAVYRMTESTISYQDIQSAYKVTFTLGYIISYLLLGLGTVLLSAILPLIYILRLNPKKIMM